MNNNIKNFKDFSEINESSVFDDLFSLNEENVMPKYSFDKFKESFGSVLMESEDYADDDMLYEAHSYYELSMLAEARSNWNDTKGDVNYIDVESHVILIKNSEAFVIEKKTFEMTQSLNEWWEIPSWGDITNTFNSFKNKVIDYAKEKIKSGKEFLSKAWNKITDGAKKAWFWVKTAAAAAGKLIGDNIETIGLVLSILSALAGIIGSGVPGVTVIGGILMALNGGLHIYEGFHKSHQAIEASKSIEANSVGKFAASFVNVAPDYILGGTFITLGFYDISHGLTEALANPSAGSVSAAVHGTAKKAAHSWLGKGAHGIEKLLVGWLDKIMKNKALLSKFSNPALAVMTFLLANFFSDACGWLYEGVLKTASSVTKGIDWLLSIPKRLEDSITKIVMGAEGVIQNIIAKGLELLVKPLVGFLAKICEKYFRPLVQKTKKWFDGQLAVKKLIDEKMKAHGGHGEHTGESIPKVKGKALIKSNPAKGDPKDLKLIKKLPKINHDLKKAAEGTPYKHIKESLTHIKSFNDLGFC